MPQENSKLPLTEVVYDCTRGHRSPDEIDGEQTIIDCVAETATAVHEHRIDIYI